MGVSIRGLPGQHRMEESCDRHVASGGFTSSALCVKASN